MKVYLITCGEYSDYGVAHVTLDRDLAYKYVDLKDRTERYFSDYQVEEYDTDDFPKLSFEEMEKEASEYIDAYRVGINRKKHKLDAPPVKCHAKRDELNRFSRYPFESELVDYVFVEADTEEKAVKIAVDLWFKKRAEEEGLI